MKSFVSTAAAVVLALGVSSAASAQSFQGPFVGIQGGWSQDDLGNPSSKIGELPVDTSSDAASFGLFAGYDLTLGDRVVVGAEAGLQFGLDDRFSRSNGTALVTIDPRRTFDLTARAGYLVGEDTLLYARGGYTNARTRAVVTDAGGIRSATDNRDGWLVGGGIEHSLIDALSARLEYRYSDFGEGDGKYDRHQTLLGVTYRF